MVLFRFGRQDICLDWVIHCFQHNCAFIEIPLNSREPAVDCTFEGANDGILLGYRRF